MEKKSFSAKGVLPDELLDAVRAFLSSASVDRLSKTLRNQFLSHIYYESDAPALDLEDYVLDLQALFDLLDVMEKTPLTGSSSL
jgi:hypothetical protein